MLVIGVNVWCCVRNVCRIIIWKDLNWKMCKKDPYNCGKGPVYTVFDLKITVFLLTVMYKVILQLLWNIWFYIVFKKGDIIMTLGNDNAGNWSKCVMLCSVNMICIYKFHFLLCISIHLCKSFPRVIIISPFLKTI
jgi:hypothetical protein